MRAARPPGPCACLLNECCAADRGRRYRGAAEDQEEEAEEDEEYEDEDEFDDEADEDEALGALTEAPEGFEYVATDEAPDIVFAMAVIAAHGVRPQHCMRS